MNCEILETLYIRSNGDIPCHDDAGETILLGRVEPDNPDWDILTVFDHPFYQHIRTALRNGAAPWPETCASCALLRPYKPFTDRLSERRIRTLQVEPSLACHLSCPGCSQSAQIRTRPKPHLMSLALFDRALGSLRRGAFRMNEVEYCGQGEPLLHPSFPRFVETSREQAPEARQRLITSGNFDYWKATGGVPLDEIFVSCDGLYPENHVKYRLGGDVRLPLAFMREAPRQAQGCRQTILWKYILFEFNDSDDEIRSAQQTAQDLEVDVLLFVFTHSAYKSQRYTAANASEFPLLFPNVMTNATPVHDRDLIEAVAEGETGLANRHHWDDGMCVLDQVAEVGGAIYVRGWALAQRPIEAIQVELHGHPIGRARLSLFRPDVFRDHPQFGNRNSGFDLRVSGISPEGLQIVGVTLFLEPFGQVRFERRFRFPNSLVRIGAAPTLPDGNESGNVDSDFRVVCGNTRGALGCRRAAVWPPAYPLKI